VQVIQQLSPYVISSGQLLSQRAKVDKMLQKKMINECIRFAF